MTDTTASRTRNAAATRASLLAAARECFARDSYEQVGVRDIGALAGVDPALVCRYFGGKEELFAEALTTSGSDPMRIIAGDRAGFGLRVARAVFQPEEDSADRDMAFVRLALRAAGSPVGRKLARRDIEARFVVPFAEWLGSADGLERARLVASVLMGVTALRDVLFATPGEEDGEEAVHRLADLLQHIIDRPACR